MNKNLSGKLNIYDDADISSLAGIFNLREKEGDFSFRRQNVHRILVSLLKHGRKSPEGDVYTPEEIEAIYRRRGFDLDVEQILKYGFICNGAAYKFAETRDKKYRIYEAELRED